MPHTFHIHRESLKRKYAVYVVVAKSDSHIDLYVGKVGDNREGCNPLISRCGNHFSYNEIHSQIRNKIIAHEARDYTYVFEHFDSYSENPDERRISIDRINEMERWLNQEIQNLVAKSTSLTLINPYKGTGYIRKQERTKRASFRTKAAETKIDATVTAVLAACA
ncbi:hypothetical protein ALQ25_01312 [Pseudomonas coronafaciens pv. atropurpurea]|nr:hypothetical protein ALQ25_01312 [Pseudomonas coronafaciens pv. atropurpurea]